MKKLQWKVCGMREPDNIFALAALAPDYMGFIFYEKSPRYVREYLNAESISQLPASIKRTGVFVNASVAQVMEDIRQFGLQAVQLHGDESPEYCHLIRSLGLEVIKAFPVNDMTNFKELEAYYPVIDYVLFDTASASRGGSGQRFDWRILKNYSQQLPFFLSGGIDVNALQEIEQINDLNLYAIDINSKVEIKPGLKDLERVQEIQKFVNRYNEAYV
ncbi:phosphoribosylanthranilate isomerase [Cytophagales bacterium LB-30]|uniref:N-(5'-phosphoribosyl)anthranilate isomerase n=1 Tax=Shiella aurantiaca TaxID=3058365 RepID=A0ABT8F7T4_9BACT|nr:phosphoribosylanthranilate isomerase [Shiella aurantiaca]MDN4166445.1 phosphoribosylanthranilate isomerase [Shiella aurantiaca]